MMLQSLKLHLLLLLLGVVLVCARAFLSQQTDALVSHSLLLPPRRPKGMQLQISQLPRRIIILLLLLDLRLEMSPLMTHFRFHLQRMRLL